MTDRRDGMPLSECEMRKVVSAISVQAGREPAVGTIAYMVAERLALAAIDALPDDAERGRALVHRLFACNRATVLWEQALAELRAWSMEAWNEPAADRGAVSGDLDDNQAGGTDG